LDVLVNNAGAVWAAPLEDFPEEAFEKIMNLNLKK
jgi:NAD(P)-dependent dehydrogenase (short-subunit alcohol dehydrogenase family)